MALPQIYRLKSQRDFSLVYQQGKRFRSPHLLLRLRSHQPYLPAQGNSSSGTANLPSRLGVSISQKVAKRAVVRNRIRRQIHAAYCHLSPQVARGWDFVLSVYPEAVECDYWQFLQELKQLLTDAEVLYEH